MKIDFTGTVAWAAVKPGRLAFDVGKSDMLRKAIHKLAAAEKKRGSPYELSLSLEIRYREKTNLQLSTYYSLIKILATEWNGGQIGPDMLDAEYADIAMKQLPWWPKVETPRGLVPKLKRKMSTMELAQVIDAIFDELSQMGVEVSDPAEIGLYWQRWRQFINDEGVDYVEGVFNSDQYKDRVGSCEACGKYLRDGGGSLAHIKSVGMGGDRTAETKFGSSERMFLCDTHHAQFDNGMGRDRFLEQFPHLTRKVEAVLKKSVVQTVIDVFEGEIQDDLY